MVKDLQDFIAKVQADKALQDKLAGVVKESAQDNIFDNCNAVAKEMGYTITREDMETFADEHKVDLSDADLDKVAGGSSWVVGTIVSTAMMSAMSGSYIGVNKLAEVIDPKN